MSFPTSAGIGSPGLSFSSRLGLVLGGFLMSFLVFFSLLAWFFVRDSLHAQLDAIARNQLLAAVASLEERTENLEAQLQALGRCLSLQWGPQPQPPGFASSLLRKTLDSLDREEIAGIYLASDGLPATNPESFIWFRHARGGGTIIPGGPIRFDFHNETPLTAWYHRARDTKKVVLSEPYFDLGDSEEKVISLSVPVFDSEQKFRGVLGLDIRIEAIEAVRRKLRLYTVGSKETQEAKILETGFICSPQGRILAHPDLRWLPSVSHPFGFNVVDVPLGDRVADKREGYEVIWMEGERYRISWATSSDLGWKLVLVVPESVLNEPIRNLGLVLAGIFLVSSVIIFFLVRIITRKLSEPLELLQQSARTNSTHSPRVHALALRNDEIGMVVRWLLRLSEHASEQDDRNRFELMRAFRLELARQLSNLKLDLGAEAVTWDAKRVAEEMQEMGFPVEPTQIRMPPEGLKPGKQTLSIHLSDDIRQDVEFVVKES